MTKYNKTKTALSLSYSETKTALIIHSNQFWLCLTPRGLISLLHSTNHLVYNLFSLISVHNYTFLSVKYIKVLKNCKKCTTEKKD